MAGATRDAQAAGDGTHGERTGSFAEGQRQTTEGSEVHGRFSTGQEALATDESMRVGRFSDRQADGVERAVPIAAVQNDHGLSTMGFRTAFARRKEVTSRASELGLIERANREVFHDRGFTLTWDTETGDLWLTPTEHPEGWWYEEDVS
jgi:hypothetical protein